MASAATGRGAGRRLRVIAGGGRVGGDGPSPQAAALSAESHPGVIEIELPGESRVRIHGTVEAAALRQVLAALRGG